MIAKLLPLAWRVTRSLLPLAGAVVAVVVICLLGKLAWDSLVHLDRYQLPFNQIDCPAPPGLERTAFLDEVQYLAAMPERIHVLEDSMASRLAAAFTKHPWVDKVERVEIEGPERVVVRLTFRKPVLAVLVSGIGMRAADRHGILLPGTAKTEGLPVYSGVAAPPAGPAGTRWGDAGVEAAARAAAK